MTNIQRRNRRRNRRRETRKMAKEAFYSAYWLLEIDGYDNFHNTPTRTLAALVKMEKRFRQLAESAQHHLDMRFMRNRQERFFRMMGCM